MAGANADVIKARVLSLSGLLWEKSLRRADDPSYVGVEKKEWLERSMRWQAFREHGVQLAASLLGQGRGEEADRLLEQVLTACSRTRKEAAEVARWCDLKALAERWNPAPAKPSGS